MDTIGGSKPPQPPAASAAGENAAVTVQVIGAGTAQKDDVAKAIEVQEHGKKPAKKAAESNMKHYFVSILQCKNCCFANVYVQRVFTYGTKLDFFLIILCCLTSIGSGITMPLMLIVFGALHG
jgi:predicted nucleic-acid-binding Zn-ribbon protein